MAAARDVSGIVLGHALLAACALLYVTWWAIFFHPGARPAGALYVFGVVCILGAALTGIGGAIAVGTSLSAASAARAVPLPAFALGAVLAYLLLAFVTQRAFARPITTELLLIVAWTALELACTSVLAASDAVSFGAASLLFGLIIVLAAGCLVCYVLYYSLPPLLSFIDGAVPLVAVGIEALVVVALLR